MEGVKLSFYFQLTFSLNLKHADGVLWAERTELAGGQRVTATPWHRRAQVERPHERHSTHHRHAFLNLNVLKVSIFQRYNQCLSLRK